MGCGGTPGSRRSKLVPGCAAGAYTPEVPGPVARCRAPPPPRPQMPRGLGSRAMRLWPRCCWALGGGGRRRCEGSGFPASGLTRTFSNSPEEFQEKKKVFSLSRFWLAALFLLLRGWETKSKTFYRRMSRRTQSRKVFLLRGALENPPVPLSRGQGTE